MNTTNSHKKFTQFLLHWNSTANQRTMPWKGEKDAYKIWLSEIILQQTRVEQGLEYYKKIIANYPTITHLANAKDAQVFKLWEGLGYYSRCKNLLVAARFVQEKYKGVFPDTYDKILELKGVGNYTAAAIASFAYNLPYAVVDGNVYRVLSRVFAIDLPIDTTEGKKHFAQLAQQLLSKQQPAQYNQAIMDLGATVCKPKQPLCMDCPFQKICVAHKTNTIEQYPIKTKKIEIKQRWFYYLVIEHNHKIAIAQRTEKDIWQNLFQFYLVETAAEEKLNNLIVKNWLHQKLNYNKGFTIQNISKLLQQQLTHRTINGKFIYIMVNQPISIENYFWIKKEELKNYAFPKLINTYWQQNELML